MKKFYLIIILSTIYLSVCHAQTGWHQLQNKPPIPKDRDFYDVFFLDSNKGFVLGGDAPYGSILFKTIDGGNTWAKIPLPNVVGYLYRIIFPSPDIGIIAGWRGHTTVILRSADSGKTWIHLPVDSAGQIAYALLFVDSLYCYAGTYYSENDSTGKQIYGWLFLKSTDAGLTWNGRRFGTGAPRNVYSMAFADRKRGMVVIEPDPFSGIDEGQLYQTTDGGDTWTYKKLYNEFGQGVWSRKVAHVSDKIWLVQTSYGLQRTTDDGVSWLLVARYNNFTCMECKKIESNKINICYGHDFQYGIMKSTDAGVTWFSQSPPFFELNNFSIVNEDVAYVTGYGGHLLKTTDGGGPPLSVTNEDSFLSERRMSLTPNPSSGTFSITVSSMTGGIIEVIDILGRIVQTIHTNQNEINYHISNLPEGLYYCRYGNTISKIVVLK